MPLSVLVIGFALMITRLLVIAWRVAVLKETDAVLGDEGREAIEQFAESDVPDKAGERAE